MGMGPIPYSAVSRYADAHGFDGDLLGTFIVIIRSMDGAYREAMQEASGAQGGGSAKSPKLTA